MPKKNILYIHHGVGIGGAPISLLNLIKKLDKQKYNLKVASLQGGEHVELFKKEGFTVDIIGAPRTYFSHTQTGKKQWYYLPYYFIVFLVWLYTAYVVAPKYLKKQNFDILHLNSHALTSWAFAGKRLNKKIILHNREAITRGYFGIRYGLLKKLIKKNVDHIINISKDNKSRLGIFTNSSVVYNFIEIPSTYRKPLSQNDTIKNVLYLGGTAKIKGFQIIAESLKHINQDIRLLFCGHIEKSKVGFSLNNIKSFFRDTNRYLELVENADNCKVIGRVMDPYHYIDSCDILLSPFTIEHFSRPAIEAFAYGKPVIASNVEGMDEIIDDDVNGLLIEKNNSLELAKAINNLCNNSEKLISLGEKGREKALEIFSPKPNVKKVEYIYDTIYS